MSKIDDLEEKFIRAKEDEWQAAKEADAALETYKKALANLAKVRRGLRATATALRRAKEGQ